MNMKNVFICVKNVWIENFNFNDTMTLTSKGNLMFQKEQCNYVLFDYTMKLFCF